jgi:hypothetical protein
MKKVISIILIMLICSFAHAQEPPLDFKGLALKSDISIIEKDTRFECKDPQAPIADIVCMLKPYEQETIAGAPIESYFLSYYDGKLENIRISFKEDHFSRVADALVIKYGSVSPHKTIVKNRMGASFENVLYLWTRNDSRLSAERYSSNLETSTIIFQTSHWSDEFAKRRKAHNKEKAGDL